MISGIKLRIHMAGIAGILAFDLAHAKERLLTMLSWCGASSKDAAKGEKKEFQDAMGCYIGSCGGAFAKNLQNSIFVAFSGKLTKKNRVLGTLSRHTPDEEDNDAALVLAAYETHGSHSFSLFEGEYAFALVDTQNRQLYIVRSRSGGEDLYWFSNENVLLFSSSLKALLSTGQVAQAPDLDSLANYLFLGYISQDKTPIQGVNRVLPGYSLKVSFDGKTVISSFWSYSAAFTKSKMCGIGTSDELFQVLSAKINQSVKARYEKSMPYPAVLGNTAGSKIIQKAFAETTDEPPIPALACTYEQTSRELPLPHAMSTITPEKFLEALVPMIWTMETPIADRDTVVSWHYASLCAKHNLSPFFDSGCDAEFSRYHYEGPSSNLVVRFQPTLYGKLRSSVHEGLYSLLHFLFPKSAFSFLQKVQQEDPRIGYFEAKALLPKEELLEASPSLGRLFSTDIFFHQFYHLHRITSMPASLFYLTFKTEVIDKIHTPRSKIAASFGASCQAPFLDTELLEFLASLSEAIWASPDMLPSFAGNYLREATPIVPAIDLSSWFGNAGISSLFNSLSGGLLVESGFITHSFLDRMMRRKQDENFRILYSLVVLEIWMRLFIDMPLSPSNVEIPLQDLLQISQK
jgi:asparagine synthase (glutamine-hydrolysing)